MNELDRMKQLAGIIKESAMPTSGNGMNEKQEEEQVDEHVKSSWVEEQDNDIAVDNQFDETIELGDETVDQPGWYIYDASSGDVCDGPYGSDREAQNKSQYRRWYDPAIHEIGYGVDDNGVFVDQETGNSENDWAWHKGMASQHDANVGNDETDQGLEEKAPKGWEGTVKGMKKHPEIDNPWALANYMKDKGYKSHMEEDEVDEHIKKAGSEYELVSHTGKNLGKYPSKAGAEKREKQVNYFKHANEELETNAFAQRAGLSLDDYPQVADAVRYFQHMMDNFVDPDTAYKKATDMLDPKFHRQFDTALSIYTPDDEEVDNAFNDHTNNIDDHGTMEEEFDLNNGYDDIKYSKGSDYFPNGADSPVTKDVGPAGARQGDNPEQKKMQVAETHKELVYNYRKFLEESTEK